LQNPCYCELMTFVYELWLVMESILVAAM